jgi:uncharacterized RDD family membrane protein YckC
MNDTNHQREKKLFMQNNNKIHANVFLRFGAFFIDLLIVGILLLIATGGSVLLLLLRNLFVEPTLSSLDDIGLFLGTNLIFQLFLLSVFVVYYCYLWKEKGQTFGMKFFHIKIQNLNGSKITFTQGIIRLSTACLGLGNIFAIFNNKNAFQDLWSDCELVVFK